MSSASETFAIDLDALIRICQAATDRESDGFERELRDCGIPAALRGYVMRRVDEVERHDSSDDEDHFDDDAYDEGFEDGKAAVLDRLGDLADEVKVKKGQAVAV